MYQNDLKWYREIGFPEAVVDAAEVMAVRVEKYYEMEFNRLFISNTRDANHEDYSSLWLFTDKDVVECKNFLIRLDVDITKYKDRIKYFNIISNDYSSIESPNVDSILKLEVSMVTEIRCIFDAVGTNCTRLNEIAKFFLDEYKKIQ